MTVEVTPRAVEVLARAFALGRMDPATVGVRITVARGLRGEEVRTGFTEEAEETEETVVAGGIKIFLSAELAGRGAVVDVADEHDRIVIR